MTEGSTSKWSGIRGTLRVYLRLSRMCSASRSRIRNRSLTDAPACSFFHLNSVSALTPYMQHTSATARRD